MRHLFLPAFLAPLTACVAPQGGPDAITAALAGRSADYSFATDLPMEDRTIQTWHADGRTEIANDHDLYTTDIAGHWKVENGRYCEIFGSQTEWNCLQVTFPEAGQVRFKEHPKEIGELFIHLFAVDRTGQFLPQGS